MTALVLLGLLVGAPTGETDVVYERHTLVIFDDDTVDGRLSAADLGTIESRKDTRHESLIQARESFRTEVLRSIARL